MFPAKFEYVAARSVDEAIGLLERENGDAKLLSGGHSLLPLMKLRLAQPRLLVDIGRIPGLAYVREEGDELAIGGLTTYRQLLLSEEVERRIPVLAEAARQVGDQQVRARGTLAGALAHADPAADMPAVVLALGGKVVAVGPGGRREIPLDAFFVDMLTTALNENDLVTEVRLQIPSGRTGGAYQKFEQPASHYALTGACAVLTLAADGSIEQARLGLTGVGPKAYRATRAEQALAGARPDEDIVRAAVESVAEGVDVQGDIHASPDYRAHLARVMARRAVLRAAERAAGAR